MNGFERLGWAYLRFLFEHGLAEVSLESLRRVAGLCGMTLEVRLVKSEVEDGPEGGGAGVPGGDGAGGGVALAEGTAERETVRIS